jgi:hypothetical protein
MKTKLNWKKKWLDDKSGYWFSAKVPIIGWEYIVDTHYNVGIDCGYVSGFYYANYCVNANYCDDITRVSNKFYKTEEAAMKACEKHLVNTAEKFKKWVNRK